jgi:hypothetical protein
MSAILPHRTIISSTCVSLAANESDKNIEGHLRQKLNKNLIHKCTEDGIYILGDIEILYRPTAGRIDSVRPSTVNTIYPLFYQASGLHLKENDIIYNAQIVAVTPNEIIFTIPGIIDGIILPINLPKDYQMRYSEGDLVNVKLVNADYIKNAKTIVVTGNISNLTYITKSFRQMDFIRNKMNSIFSSLGDGPVLKIHTIVENLHLTKESREFAKYPKAIVSDFINHFTPTVDHDKYEKNGMMYMEWNELFVNFRIKNDESMVYINPALSEKTDIILAYKEHYDNAKFTEKVVPEVNLYISNDTLEQEIVKFIKTSQFPENMILKMTLNMSNSDAMYMYLLTGIYQNVSLYIPEISRYDTEFVFLICIDRAQNTIINYDKLASANVDKRNIFREGGITYKYLESNLSYYLNSIKHLVRLFDKKITHEIEKNNQKLNLNKKDQIFKEKMEYSESYISRYLVDSFEVEEQAGGEYESYDEYTYESYGGYETGEDEESYD